MAQYPDGPAAGVHRRLLRWRARRTASCARDHPGCFPRRAAQCGQRHQSVPCDVPLPPAELFRRFQESSRLVYFTGERDEENLIARDVQSRRSLEKWCVYDVLTQTEPRTGHELADASAFGRSLEALLGERHSNPGKLEACRARIDQELRTQLGQVENAFTRGDSNGAKRLLSQLDARYGGLAAPRSVEFLTPRN